MAQSEFEWPALGSIRDGLDWPWPVGLHVGPASCSISDTFSWYSNSAFFVHSELSVNLSSWELDHLESYLTRIRRLVTAINVGRINNLIKRGQWLKYADCQEFCQVISNSPFNSSEKWVDGVYLTSFRFWRFSTIFLGQTDWKFRFLWGNIFWFFKLKVILSNTLDFERHSFQRMMLFARSRS